MNRRPLSVLLALSCSVSAPASARAAGIAPESVEARAEGLFEAGNYPEAIQVWTDALKAVPEGPDSRAQRNSWAIGAVNAYELAFDADPKQCAVIADGLALAEQYLKELLEEYGRQATNSDEYAGMSVLRGELDQARGKHACPTRTDAVADLPEPTVDFLPIRPGSSRRRPGPKPGPGSDPAEPTAPASPTGASASRSAGDRGLAIGTGVSASLMVGMAIASVATYVQVRDPSGPAYRRIYDAAVANLVKNDEDTDLCSAGQDVAAVATACQRWTALNRTSIATAAFAGVFAVSTAVFAGLLIRQRRQAGHATALLRQHHSSLSAIPHREGGASLSASFRF